MFVVFEFKDKQYKVSEGDLLKIPRVEKLKKDDDINFEKILFINSDSTGMRIGTPYVKGVSIKAKVIEQIRDKKIIVFKKKRRHNYRRKIGHRQDLTLIRIKSLNLSSDKKTITKSEDKDILDPIEKKKNKEDVNGS